jgi:hypothetical protein
MGNRIKAAIEFLKEGRYFKVDDIRLGINELGDIEVAGWSQYSNIENLTKAICLKELNETKSLFYKMLENSSELKRFIQEKGIEYSLYFNDNSKIFISICSEKNGILKWKIVLI